MLMMIDCEIIGCIPEKLMMLVCPLFVVNDTFFSIARCNVSKSHNVNVNYYPNNTPTSLHTIRSNQNSIFHRIMAVS